jgi:hypothetical protein
MLDYDETKWELFMNLSHDFRMISNASYLNTFHQMPIEGLFIKPIKVRWKFRNED